MNSLHPGNIVDYFAKSLLLKGYFTLAKQSDPFGKNRSCDFVIFPRISPNCKQTMTLRKYKRFFFFQKWFRLSHTPIVFLLIGIGTPSNFCHIYRVISRSSLKNCVRNFPGVYNFPNATPSTCVSTFTYSQMYKYYCYDIHQTVVRRNSQE